MIDSETLTQVLEASEQRREERRRFMRIAGSMTLAVGVTACGGGGSGSGGGSTPTPTPTSTPTPTPSSTVALDPDYLNFALNLEYLQAQYLVRGTTGAGIEAIATSTAFPGGGAALLTGTGTQGAVTGGAQVTFSDPLNGQYAREMALEDLAHVGFLRSMIGAYAGAQPAIDLSPATGGFTKILRTAGVIGAADTFDAFASQENFLLGAFLIKDVAVSAYIGLIPKFAAQLYSNAVAGILAAEAHHAALIRSQLYMIGGTTVTTAQQISDARDLLDGAADDDQGVAAGGVANITPTDPNGLVFARTTGQALNILYNNHAVAAGGGFFPAGINGYFLKASDAN
ncbi:MAG: ferritin-like domain-containing protein [Sphingomonas sp.]